MKYLMYPSATETLVRQFWKLNQVPKHLRTDASIEECLRRLLSNRETCDDITWITLCDEYIFRKLNSVVYFPESEYLAQMLWKANMTDIGHQDLSGLPEAFVIAWPRGVVIDGVPLKGALVNIGGTATRRRYIIEILKKYTPWSENEAPPLGPPVYHCVLNSADGHWIRVSLPTAMLNAFLKTGADFAKIGDYKETFGIETSEEEKHVQYVHMRLAVRLMIYMKTLPDSVVDGYPCGVHRKELGTGVFTNWSPAQIRAPKGSHEHGSPTAHWRTWHFRHYPLKKDGTRTPGMVFVSDCVVNAEITPKTVKET